MQQVAAWPKKAFTAQVVSFIAGSLASVVIRSLFGNLYSLRIETDVFVATVRSKNIGFQP
jgi:hypothetical protein